jgi:hypothetical protein
MTGRTLSLLLAFCAAASVGCGSASSYTPQEPGRIHFVVTEKGRLLEKDGKLYSPNPLWSDVVEAVSGDPDAERHARSYRRRTWAVFPLAFLAVALLVPAATLNTTEPGHTAQRVAAGGCLVAGWTAFVLAILSPLMARHHLYDAVNVYNDNLATGTRGESPAPEREAGQPAVDAPAGGEGK